MPTLSPPKRLQIDRGQCRGEVVESLLAEVFHGRIRAGQRLVTEELSRQFGVSHTPIREALIALAGIGIIDLLPNRGAVVRRVGPRDVREICQVRRALECEAVRLACGQIDEDELDSLADGLSRLTSLKTKQRGRFLEKARSLDNQLHDLIANSSGNTYLSNELGRLKTLFRAFRDVAWQHQVDRNDYDRLIEEANQHLAIVEALQAGDRAGAIREMSRHIMSGGKYWSRALRASGHQTNGSTT